MKKIHLFYLGLYFLLTATFSFADPSRPTGGPIEVKLVPTANIVQQLNSGNIKNEQAIPMELSFFYPYLGNGNSQAKAVLIFDPIDSTLELNGQQLKPFTEDDASFDNAKSIEISLAQFKPASRISFPVTFTPKGKFGASARVTVLFRVPSNSQLPYVETVGKAAYTVGVTNGNFVKPTNSIKIFKTQLEKIKTDPKTTANLMTAQPQDTVPFIPENHSKDLQTDSQLFQSEN
jgi:hypothetical protein